MGILDFFPISFILEKTMTSKEVVYNTINLKPTPRIPAALLLGGSWVLNRHSLSLQEALGMESGAVADMLFDAYRDHDIVWAAPGSGSLVIKALGGKLKFRASGPPDVEEPLLRTPEDTGRINLDSLRDDADLKALGEINKRLVEKASGNYAVGGGMWGPVTLAGLLFGAENLMRSIYRNGDAVRRLLDWTVDVFLAYTQNYAEAGVDLVSVAEPTASGDMISKKHFAEFVVPVLKKVFVALRSKNILACLHICGNIEDRLDLLPETGAQIVSLDYKVGLKKARATLGGKMAFAGNMNPVAVMLNETPEGVEHACKVCIAEAAAADAGGFMLMPGCDIPPATPVENVEAMMRVVRKIGGTIKKTRSA
jgi:uroporphyrinogen decarboxylase